MTNRGLRVGLLVLALGMVVLGAFPPWVHTFQIPGISQVRRPAGHGFMFDPPQPRDSRLGSGIAIDGMRAGLELGALLGAACVVGLLVEVLQKRRK
jgi:hypothetical protein